MPGLFQGNIKQELLSFIPQRSYGTSLYYHPGLDPGPVGHGSLIKKDASPVINSQVLNSFRHCFSTLISPRFFLKKNTLISLKIERVS